MNAFTLFGELKADTRNFEAALKRADSEIRQTEKNLDQLEKKSKSFGATSATTARSHEKFNEQIKASKQRMQDAVVAYDQGVMSHKKMATVLTQTDAKMAALNSRMKDNAASMKDASSNMSGFYSAIATAGAAVGYFAIKATADFESLQNRLV